MSRVEAPAPIRIEGLGGSFNRNTQMDEVGLGMRYDQPGDIFDLATVWANPVNAGTVIAPGMFRYIYIREAYKNGDNLITRISPDGTTYRASMRKDHWGEHFVVEGRVEDLLANPKYAQIRIAGDPDLTDVEARPVEVVRKLWGKFHGQDQTYSSKMQQLYGEELHIPRATIEEDFNAAFSIAYVEIRAKKGIKPIEVLVYKQNKTKGIKHKRVNGRRPYINPRLFFSRS